MSLCSLLDAVAAHQALVLVEGDDLILLTPAHLPNALMGQLRAQKPALVRHLTAAIPAVRGLPARFDTDDPSEPLPAAPCLTCGTMRWRLQSHPSYEQSLLWQWICDTCCPLIVVDSDGTQWQG